MVLNRYAWESLKVFIEKAVPEKEPVPGAVIAVQTFGMLSARQHSGFNVFCCSRVFAKKSSDYGKSNALMHNGRTFIRCGKITDKIFFTNLQK
jgi:hypothetical protein